MRDLKASFISLIAAAIVTFAASTFAGEVATDESFSGSVDINGTATGLEIVFYDDQQIDLINGIDSSAPYDGYGTIFLTIGTLQLTSQSDGTLTGTLDRYLTDGTNLVHQSIDVVAETQTFFASDPSFPPIDCLLIQGTVASITQSAASSGTYDWSSISNFSYVIGVIGGGVSDIVEVAGAQTAAVSGSGELSE